MSFVVWDEIVYTIKTEHAASHKFLCFPYNVYGMVDEDISETFGRRFGTCQLSDEERLGDVSRRTNVALFKQVAAKECTLWYADALQPTAKKPSMDLSKVLKAMYVLERSRFSIVIAFFSRNSAGDESVIGLNLFRISRVVVSP